MELNIVILAAGKGTRMKSDVPKVLQRLANKSLLRHVLDTVGTLHTTEQKNVVVVHGHGAEKVRSSVEAWNVGMSVAWALQEPQQGTGHAVHCALPYLATTGYSLVLYGDVPLVQIETLDKLVSAAITSGAALLTVYLDKPTGYGRIIRVGGQIKRIVEEKDASESEKQIREVNTGILCVRTDLLHELIPAIKNHNAQNEYYLTDLIALICEKEIKVQSVQPIFDWEVEGVNDKLQLADLERKWQRHQANQLMRQGVGLADPERFDLRGTLQHGKDCYIDINTIIEGTVKFGNRVLIGANCHIKDCVIDDDVIVHDMSILEQSRLEAGSAIGPYARLRPGSSLGKHVHIGNFVEVKNTRIDDETKAGHLSYLGDAVIGGGVNIGAGTIICNYDGVQKHQTKIEDGVFIGSNNSLIAPVCIAAGATTAAGSVIHKDVPPGQLAVARGRQTNIENWKRPVQKIDQTKS